MSEIVIKGGTLVDRSGERRGDLAIEAGRIVAVGDDLSGSTVLDADGCIVTPGLVDLFPALGQPGHEESETLETAARSAALAGYTALVAAPTSSPVVDNASMVRDVLALGASTACDVHVAGAITVGAAGERLAPVGEMAALGVRLFTDGDSGVQDDRLMRRAMEYAAGLGVTLAQHCENAALSEGGHMHEGARSAMLGVPGVPAEAEELMVMRDVTLARLTGCRVHFRRLSTAGSIGIVRAARGSGMAITADVTAHHLVLTDERCETYDPVYKVTPPLRTDDDVAALRAAVADGVVDAVVSDHCPHELHQKECPFDQAPPGVVGLETAPSVLLTEVGLAPTALVQQLSVGPAALAGLADTHGGTLEPGRPANIAVLDPTQTWLVDPASLASRSRNCPFDGWSLRGKARHTINNGEPTVIDGEAQR